MSILKSCYKRIFLEDPYFVVLVCIFLFLTLWGLDNSILWNDEAITAFLGKNCIEYGYPRAHDAYNWTDPREVARLSLGPGDSWVMHPWVQYYLAAGSFLISGQNTIAARLPFALIGFFTLFPLYYALRLLFDNKNVARLSCLISATSVLLLLHMRQCRYYSVIIFSTAALIYAYLLIINNKKRGWVYFILGSLFLFYTNHGASIPIIGSIGLWYFFFDRRKIPFRQVLICALVIIACALPWYMVSYRANAANVSNIGLILLKKNFEFQIRVINKYIFPFIFYAILGGAALYLRKRIHFRISEKDKRALLFIIFIIGINVLFFCFVNQRTIRYIVHLIPLFAVIQGYVFVRWFSYQKALPVVFVCLLLGTNLLFRPYQPRFYFFNYLYEITHDYDGPVEAIVDYLRKHAKAGDTVKITYGDAQVMFYLPYLRLINDYFYKEKNFPDFIVDRHYWRQEEEIRLLQQKPDLSEEKAYLKEIENRYEKIELDAVDIIWENRPDDLGYHKFRTVTEGRPVVIYKKKQD